MQTKIYSALIFIIIIISFDKTIAQNANTKLSNLTSPVAINVSLLVDKDNAHNIGSPGQTWRNLFLDSAIYIGGKRFLTYKTGTGISNTAAGLNTLVKNTSGYANTAIGNGALYSNTYAHDNTAIGNNALYYNVSNNGNTAIGSGALYNNNGVWNTATGYQAMYANTSGEVDAAHGAYALYSNTTGNYNAALGYESLYANTTGANNIGVGFETLYTNATGNNNTAVGTYADDNTGNISNATAIGAFAQNSASDQVRIGNNSVTSIGGFANWSNVSDGRVKKNIKQNVPGLAFINKLNPITYNLDLNATDKVVGNALVKDKDGKTIALTNEELAARKAKEQIVYTGFIAQDVEKAAKDLNYDFSGVDAAKNDHDLYGLRYGDFVVPLVKAVQELSQKNDKLEMANDALQKTNSDLEKRITKLEAMMNVINISTLKDKLRSDILSQNVPNPFSNSTSINYNIQQHFSSAKIIITDKNGNALKQINLLNNKGVINVDAAVLTSGAYQYSLYVDGKIIDSKQMIFSR